MGRRWDRFLVHTRVGGSRRLRRLTPSERWALLAGAWALAGESPRRGALLIAEGIPVTVGDVAEHAGVSRSCADSALKKARILGLIEVRDGVDYIHDWHDWNPDPKPSDEPEATRERKQRQRDRERGVTRDTGVTSHPGHALKGKEVVKGSSPNGSEPSRRGEEGREDVDTLCSLLAGLIRENGRPDHLVGWPSDKWRRECRLLLDRDKRPPGEVTALIRWCQGDPFWKGNVLSMPTFRKQYDKLRLKAESEGALRKVEEWQPGMDEASRRKLEAAQK